MVTAQLEYVRSLPAKTWWITGGVLASLIGVWMLAILIQRPSTREVVPAPRVALAVSGWQIEPMSSPGDDSLAAFKGFFPLGKTVFIPAGTEFVLCSQPVGLKGELTDGGQSGSWTQNGGRLDPGAATPTGTRQMARSPMQPGLYHLTWSMASIPAKSPAPAASSASTTPVQPAIGLDVLVLTEAEAVTKGDRTTLKVNGKVIGGYLDPNQSPSKRVREHADRYQVPRYFALLTPEAAKLKLGADFELGNLVAFMDDHDKDGHKVFTTKRHTDVLPFSVELIEKLIKLRERLRQKGVKMTRFAVTSGFRTPEYNKQIGGVPYSRHCYGDAVDIYIDEDGDHHMDDLNGDGKIDRKDGEIIGNACRELELEGAVVPGGIGVYEWPGDDSVRSHVHIDCRGFISRWGQSGSGKTKKTFRWWPAAEFQEGENGE